MSFKVFGAAAIIVSASILPATAGNKIIINQYGDYNSAVAVQQVPANFERASKKGNHYGQRKQKKNKVIINQFGSGNSAAAAQ